MLIAVLAVIAVAIGITMRKKKNAREAAEALTRGTEEAQRRERSPDRKPGEMFTFNQKSGDVPLFL